MRYLCIGDLYIAMQSTEDNIMYYHFGNEVHHLSLVFRGSLHSFVPSFYILELAEASLIFVTSVMINRSRAGKKQMSITCPLNTEEYCCIQHFIDGLPECVPFQPPGSAFPQNIDLVLSTTT